MREEGNTIAKCINVLSVLQQKLSYTNTNKEKVQWLKIKWICFQRENLSYILYKPNFLTIDVCTQRKLKRKWE